jgi:hypothetical protein
MRQVTVGEPITIGDLRALVPGRFRDFVKASSISGGAS